KASSLTTPTDHSGYDDVRGTTPEPHSTALEPSSTAQPTWSGPPETITSPTPSTRTILPETTATQPPPPRPVTILGSGDVLQHPPLWTQAERDAQVKRETSSATYDFDPMFAGIAPEVAAADVAICQLET